MTLSRLTNEDKMRRLLLAPALLTISLAGCLIAPLPSGAAPIALAVTASATAATDVQHEQVLVRSVFDWRWEVRQAAGSALMNGAITEFLANGLAAAERRAHNFELVNIAEIKHAIRNSTTTSVVQLTAKRALKASHDDKDEFVRHGLAEAKRRDAEADGKGHQAVAEQAEADRAYVASLARTEPGLQVRSAANYAVSSGRDEDLAEFFFYYWVTAARLDEEAYRMRLVDLDVKGNAALVRLRTAALAAQAAEQAASEEASAKLHAETVAAWVALAASATGTSVDWAAERDRAATHAAAWGQIAEYAGSATTEQDWAAVLARATDNKQSWTDAVEESSRQADIWLALAQAAADNANGTPGTETQQ